MAVEANKRLVEQFWQAMDSNDFAAVGEFLHDDFVLEWSQSGERIRGRANFVAVNANYPTTGRWSIKINRIVAEGDEVVSDVSVTDGVDNQGRAITFSTVRDGKIASQNEFWVDPFEAAAWRAQWVERI